MQTAGTAFRRLACSATCVQVIQVCSSACDVPLQYGVCQQVTYLLRCVLVRRNSSCICAGLFERCTQRSDDYLTSLTSLLQHSDLHKAKSAQLAAYHSGTFSETPSNSPSFCIHLPVQHSLPDFRLFCTTALAVSNQAKPDISLLSSLLQSQWDHLKNAHLSNVVIKPQANTKVWWTCSQCPDGHAHKWLAAPSSRFDRKGRKGSRCPFCANRKVCQHNSLHTKAPHLVPEWSETNECSPHDFTVSSNKKAWWRCKCGCEWEATISSRTDLGTGCPDCAAVRRSSKRQRHLTCTESQHEMLQFWDWEVNAEASLDPSKLRCRSNKKAHWLCNRCVVGQVSAPSDIFQPLLVSAIALGKAPSRSNTTPTGSESLLDASNEEKVAHQAQQELKQSKLTQSSGTMTYTCVYSSLCGSIQASCGPTRVMQLGAWLHITASFNFWKSVEMHKSSVADHYRILWA